MKADEILKPAKRRPRRSKPKMLRLTPKSERSVFRLAAHLAFLDMPRWAEHGKPSQDHYKIRARDLLEHLARTE